MARRATWLALGLLATVSVSARAQDARAIYAGLSVGTHVERAERVTGTASAIALVGERWKAHIPQLHSRPAR